MAKLYTKNTWTDEVLSGNERYDIKQDDGTPINTNARIDLATTVAQAGSPISAARMNNIENGLDAVDTRADASKTALDALLAANLYLSGITILTSGSGTYTVPAGVAALEVELIGGGGGGGACTGAAAVGAGGGGGGYVKHFYSAPGASYAYGVGAAGAGGVAGNNAGSAGGDTTFGGLTGSGGSGGATMANGTAVETNLGGNGGAATGGDLNLKGSAGGNGIRLSGTVITSGIGAVGLHGQGSALARASVSAGVNAGGYGAGGGGAASTSSTDRAGGNGSAGIIIIREYKRT